MCPHLGVQLYSKVLCTPVSSQHVASYHIQHIYTESIDRASHFKATTTPLTCVHRHTLMKTQQGYGMS